MRAFSSPPHTSTLSHLFPPPASSLPQPSHLSRLRPSLTPPTSLIIIVSQVSGFIIHHPSIIVSPPPYMSHRPLIPMRLPAALPHTAPLIPPQIHHFPHPLFSNPTFIIGPSSRTSPSVIIQPSLLLPPLSSAPHSFRHPYFPSLSKITTQEFK